MINRRAPRDRALNRTGVTQITSACLDVELRNLAAQTHQRAHGVPALDQQISDMPTDKAGGSGNEYDCHELSGSPQRRGDTEKHRLVLFSAPLRLCGETHG